MTTYYIHVSFTIETDSVQQNPAAVRRRVEDGAYDMAHSFGGTVNTATLTAELDDDSQFTIAEDDSQERGYIAAPWLPMEG
jgi:ABC-type nitrate/sulfonate/bicarbonate transport system substrate-binding protein